MINWLFSLIAKVTGHNSSWTPAAVIMKQMEEKRALPIGMAEFEEWSDRIISGTGLPATGSSQKFALASMLINLNPTSDFECDAYFIKSLRKYAVNQIAAAKMEEIRSSEKARLAEIEAAAKASAAVVQ